MTTTDALRYFVIPLSIQKEEDFYLVGNADIGDFYQIPESGVTILNMLRSGNTVAAVKSALAATSPDLLDVDGFLSQMSDIGLIYLEQEKARFDQDLRAKSQKARRVFSVDARFANAIFSLPVLVCYLAIVGYALLSMIYNPSLRINWSAFYTETNRTPLLLLILLLYFINVVMHELGHMLAAARHGIKSQYGISNRLWYVVAESDLTGTMSLPKAQRYLPLFAGILVDLLNISLLTILLSSLLQSGADPFVIKITQVLVLQIFLSIGWQFNIFMKTDIYYVLCIYLSYPDLDQDARVYLNDLAARLSFGRFGSRSTSIKYKNVGVLRLFCVIWLFGRIFSLLVLFGVFLPTIWKYILSAIESFKGPPASLWHAYDTMIFAIITLTFTGTGMYMWLKDRRAQPSA